MEEKLCINNIKLFICWQSKLGDNFLHAESMRRLKVFHTKCCRSMIGVTTWEVADYSILNENVLKLVGIMSMEDIVHYRRLVWMGKIARMPLDRFPRKFLAAWTDCPIGNSYSRPHGRRQLSTRDSFLSSLEYIGLDSSNGQLQSWVPKALKEKDWKERCDGLLETEQINRIEFLNT